MTVTDVDRVLSCVVWSLRGRQLLNDGSLMAGERRVRAHVYVCTHRYTYTYTHTYIYIRVSLRRGLIDDGITSTRERGHTLES